MTLQRHFRGLWLAVAVPAAHFLSVANNPYTQSPSGTQSTKTFATADCCWPLSQLERAFFVCSPSGQDCTSQLYTNHGGLDGFGPCQGSPVCLVNTMTQLLADQPGVQAPTTLSSPASCEVLRTLLSGTTAGGAVGRGNSSEVHACQADPRYVIKTIRQQDEVEWQRELAKLRPGQTLHDCMFRPQRLRWMLRRLHLGYGASG